MAPTDDGRVEGERKGEGVVEKESLCDLTSSLTHLTLQEINTHTDITKLEHQLASVHLLDTLAQVEDLKNSKHQESQTPQEEEEEEEEETERENKDDDVERDERKYIEIGKENREQDNDTEEETEEEIKKDGGKEIEVCDKKVKETSQDKPENQEEEEEEEEKEEEEEEEGVSSHDENPTDEEDRRTEAKRKDRKLRSRGFGYVAGHGYSASPYMDYTGGSAYPQPFQCQMSPQHSQQYPGAWGPQYVQMPEASVSHPASESQQDGGDTSDLEAVAYETLQYDGTSGHSSSSSDFVYQEYSSSPPYMSPLISAPNYFPSLPTPPVSPQPAPTLTPKPDAAAAAAAAAATASHDDSFLVRVINSVMQEPHFDMSPYDKNIIEIKKSLLDIGNISSDNIEEDLNEELYENYSRGCAKLTDECLLQGDNDGDIAYMRAAVTGQCKEDYKEKLVAFTDRMEKMELCCDKLVNWRIKICEVCGQSDPEQFYSPLSWINNHGEMLLPNLVHLKFPVQVVEYITNKIMKRQMDVIRTFGQHKDTLYEESRLYPCLMKGLMKLRCG